MASHKPPAALSIPGWPSDRQSASRLRPKSHNCASPTGSARRRRFEPRLRVRRAEEVAAGADILDRLKTERILGQIERRQELGDHLQQVDVEDHLLIRAGQPALHPARAVQHEIAAAHDRSPEREDTFIGSLRVHRVGGAGVGGAVGQAIFAAPAARRHAGLSYIPACQRRARRFSCQRLR